MDTATPHARAPLDWTIICDFDGTIAHADVTDLLLERFAGAEWKLIERRWQAGRMSSRDCLQDQVQLLRLTRQEMSDLLSEVRIDPDFADFVAAARGAGCEVLVASEGFDQVIRPLLARAGVPRLSIASTYLIPAGRDAWMLGFPFGLAECAANAATCKCALAAAARKQGRRIVLIGDGRSDFCLAGRADMVFARGKLLEYCRLHGLSHEVVVDFKAARHQLALASRRARRSAGTLQARGDGCHG